MRSMQRIFVFVTLLLAANSQNVLLTNDDGWAVAQIRAQNDALIDSGFSVCTLFLRHEAERVQLNGICRWCFLHLQRMSRGQAP